VIVLIEYQTGDAAGQNMITIATKAVCDFICENSPVAPRCVYIECNYSGDKKPTARSFIGGRGRRVTAEAVISGELTQRFLKVTPKQMALVWRDGVLGSFMSGSFGVQAHFANGLAALFLATGQDVACVAESAVGVTRFEETEHGDLYAAVTLPSLVVGTVGGGTGLRTQAACLRIADSQGSGSAASFAELCAGLCLAGELSLTAAIAANEFVRAHRRHARGRG
jgi:hydroxymethylglutaryl-CoA reductase (NADPH)